MPLLLLCEEGAIVNVRSTHYVRAQCTIDFAVKLHSTGEGNVEVAGGLNLMKWC